MSARVSRRNGRISRKDDKYDGPSKLSDARGTLNLLNNVMRVVRFWWYIGDTGSPIVKKSCKPWITYDTLACYIIHNRKSARILNNFVDRLLLTTTAALHLNSTHTAAATSKCHPLQ